MGTATMGVDTAGAAMEALAGKYLTFKLGMEAYGLAILKVQEIVGIMPVTQIPRMPEFIRGVVNLRGKVIPVIDLRLKFNMASQENTDRTCIIVVQVARKSAQVTMGVIVDEVSEVLNIPSSVIEPPPSFGQAVEADFILGMGKVADKVIMLLDVDRVLSGDEFALCSTGSDEGNAAE